MVRISIGETKYKVPNNFVELSIGKYQELSVVKDENKIKMIIEFLTILTGLELDVIKNLKLTDIKKLTSSFNFKLSKDYPLVQAVKIKGKTYRLDEKLNNMRFDMFIDLEEMTKDKDLVIDNLHLIMAILYRPAIKKIFRKKLLVEDYDSESVIERAEFFKENLMMDKVVGALFFFINLRTTYIADLVDYLGQEKEKKEKVEKN
jgi:hypothetical protein